MNGSEAREWRARLSSSSTRLAAKELQGFSRSPGLPFQDTLVGTDLGGDFHEIMPRVQGRGGQNGTAR